MERTVRTANGTDLRIDEVGDAGAPLIVQLEGHMAQLIATPESYCRLLAEEGFRVVRVDNRDVGGSSRFPGRSYRLTEMAEDVHGLIGELGRPAVVCGRSMGGAIAQLLAIRHPDDVLGLGLFFTFAKEAPPREPPAPTMAPFHDQATFVAWEQQTLPGIAGSAHPFPAAYITWLATTMWRRGVDWSGFERQRRAMELEPPWGADLARVTVPTVIVHGEEDLIVPPAAGNGWPRCCPTRSCESSRAWATNSPRHWMPSSPRPHSPSPDAERPRPAGTRHLRTRTCQG
ncbi:MAG: alpha/beta hydrolase [Propionibacteriaceae bacterium]|nr:alpha/beta hydrolase [Propionibacteriaceae bacterium]